MTRYIMMLFSLVGIASPFLGAQESAEKLFKKDELPSKAWLYYTETSDSVEWAIVTKDNGTTLSFIDKKGNKRKVSNSDVVSVKKNQRRISPTPKGKFHYDSGFFFSYSRSIRIASAQTAVKTGQTQLGYRFNKRFQLGGGLALDIYGDNFTTSDFFRTDFNFASIYAFGRFIITDKPTRIYAYSRLGHGLSVELNFFSEEFSNGPQWHPGIGISFASRNNVKFNIEIGYALQQTSGEREITDRITGQTIMSEFSTTFRRPMLKFGVEIF